MKIFKWLNRYYDYLFSETSNDFRESYHDGEVRIIPFIIVVFTLFLGLMFLLQWIYN